MFFIFCFLDVPYSNKIILDIAARKRKWYMLSVRISQVFSHEIFLLSRQLPPFYYVFPALLLSCKTRYFSFRITRPKYSSFPFYMILIILADLFNFCLSTRCVASVYVCLYVRGVEKCETKSILIQKLSCVTRDVVLFVILRLHQMGWILLHMTL